MKFLSNPLRWALAGMLIVASIPASATVWKWSQTAASNSNSDATVNWAEGMAPSAVNDSARAVMAAIAKWRDDLSGAKPSNAIVETGGTVSAYTLTSNQTLTALTNGFTITFRVGSGLTNTGTVTLAVDGLTAKTIQGVNGTNLTGGELLAGSTYTVTYFATADKWLLHDFYAGSTATPPGTVHVYAGTSAPTGYLLMYGQCVSRTTYAALFVVLSTTFDNACGGTEFGIPDMRGRVPVGQDDMGGSSANRVTDAESDSLNGDTFGDTGGVETQTLSEAEMASHSHDSGTYEVTDQHDHTFSDTSSSNGSHTHGYSDGGTGSLDIQDSGNNTTIADNTSDDETTDSSGTHTHSVSGTTSESTDASLDVSGNTGTAGSDEAHSVMQPSIVLNYIIKT